MSVRDSTTIVLSAALKMVSNIASAIDSLADRSASAGPSIILPPHIKDWKVIEGSSSGFAGIMTDNWNGLYRRVSLRETINVGYTMVGSRQVPVTPGKSYFITGKFGSTSLGSTSGSGQLSIRLKYNTGSTEDLINVTDSSYSSSYAVNSVKSFTKTWTCPSGVTSVQLCIRSQQWNAWVHAGNLDIYPFTPSDELLTGTLTSTGGSILHPAGSIHKWGITTATSSSLSGTTLFPVAFPTQCDNITIGTCLRSDSTTNWQFIGINRVYRDYFTWSCRNLKNTTWSDGTTNLRFYWQAIGR